MTTTPARTEAATTTWRVLPAPHATSLEQPEAWAYRGIAAVESAATTAEFGDDDIAPRAIDVLVGMKHQQYVRRERLVAVEDGPDGAPTVVGHGVLFLPLADNRHLAEIRVVVAPNHRRRGIGSALYERLRRRAEEEGRTTLLGEVEFAAEPDADDPDALRPPSGNGLVSADLPGMAFGRRQGLGLELVARRSALDLPLPGGAAERFEAEARAVAGEEYRTHTWVDAIPDEWIDQYAALEQRLSVDEPNAGLDLEPEVWDAARVRMVLDQNAERDQGFVVTVAEHVPTGELAGMTTLVWRRDRPACTEQESTVVLPEHRGHRLGMLVKAVNLRAHARLRPETRRIYTWNNEDNAHMLAINVALGFRPAGGSAELQARLADLPPAT
ncbi:GNAT family N-acetyltransferase [Isoptericola variabilis]|uniref:GCN5-related N-acetyltransferase n=1 Tax=Isoptericola variabilis (strain 225) TaxID=743718 RepID=F6FW89_ISOV2|nr:GNAT family N-acetyltransferase [Isoptericola variabilis]AEG45633.1 GCN5-related N-acetyltransferase [Isoptericola variabilis 225]TWH25758.1 Sortase and related acyltransferases [Isoptericola variabilis J7]